MLPLPLLLFLALSACCLSPHSSPLFPPPPPLPSGLDSFRDPNNLTQLLFPIGCAGPRHAHFRDLDGSLTGSVGSINGYSHNLFKSTDAAVPDTPRMFPFDQGSPVIPGPCTFSSVIDGYDCLVNQSNYALPYPYMKPVPTPKYGIYGNPQHFVLESLDADSEVRVPPWLCPGPPAFASFLVCLLAPESLGFAGLLGPERV